MRAILGVIHRHPGALLRSVVISFRRGRLAQEDTLFFLPSRGDFSEYWVFIINSCFSCHSWFLFFFFVVSLLLSNLSPLSQWFLRSISEIWTFLNFWSGNYFSNTRRVFRLLPDMLPQKGEIFLDPKVSLLIRVFRVIRGSSSSSSICVFCVICGLNFFGF